MVATTARLFKMSSGDAPSHWQDSSLKRNQERIRRAELWKEEKIFPLDYVPSESTLALFKMWGLYINDQSMLEKIDKNGKNKDTIQEFIISRIRNAFYKALEAFTYKCILLVWFPTPNVCLHPNYDEIFKKYKDCSEVKFVDIGCCMGTDLRYVCCNHKNNISIQSVLGIDIQEEFFDIGCNLLFNDVSVIRERFVKTNILDDDYLEKCSNAPLLKSFLNNPSSENIKEGEELQRKGTDIVYCSTVFHLLSELQTQKLSSFVFKDFLKNSGGIFFGKTVGCTDPVLPERHHEKRDIFGFSFVHSLQSLKEMLEKIGFVNVRTCVSQEYTTKQLIRKDLSEEGKDNEEIKETVPKRCEISWYAEKL